MPSQLNCVGFFALFPYIAGGPKWVLLDGDKIAALFAMLIQQEMQAAGLLAPSAGTPGLCVVRYSHCCNEIDYTPLKCACEM
jgi:hypothetical protein